MIELLDLTKRYGDKTVVDRVSFTVQPGVVTGYLGPNGAGKSTTMRMLLGLTRPSSGTALINGRSYADSVAPMSQVGALLDAKAVDGGRSARNHLRALAATAGFGKARVDDALETVGLTDVADKQVGSFSLGMAQRLGIATALIGDPAVVMLDEPVNGLDPNGIKWIRSLLRNLAAEGRTVLLSSHLMSEMELTADHLVIIGRGRILANTSMADFIASSDTGRVHVSSPDTAQLQQLLENVGATYQTTHTDADEIRVAVDGLPAAQLGRLAKQHHLELHELSPVKPSLEEAFMALTASSVEYHGATSAAHTTQGSTR